MVSLGFGRVGGLSHLTRPIVLLWEGPLLPSTISYFKTIVELSYFYLTIIIFDRFRSYNLFPFVCMFRYHLL